MNITEKILARASEKNTVSPDDIVFAKVDKVMVHDVSGPGVLKVFDKLQKQGIDTSKLHDPTKVWIAEDHFVPTAEKISADNIVKLSNFSKKHDIKNWFSSYQTFSLVLLEYCKYIIENLIIKIFRI